MDKVKFKKRQCYFTPQQEEFLKVHSNTTGLMRSEIIRAALNLFIEKVNKKK